jgi:penicillin-binding protein 2
MFDHHWGQGLVASAIALPFWYGWVLGIIMIRRWWVGWAVLMLLVAGCASESRQSVEEIPTLFPTSLPSTLGMDSAERVARLFLDAWQRSDLDGMYNLTSFASQQATPPDSFKSLYQSSQDEMTLISLTYTANTMLRQSPRVILFNYDVTFNTHILGKFTDKDRNLQLVVDDRSGEWRVAWSPGDIFPEMSSGGRLRLERIVPSRANIYDRSGENVLADQLGRVVAVNVIKQDIPNDQACFNDLVQALNKPPEAVQAVLNKANADWLTEVGVMESGVYLTAHQQLETDCQAQFQDRATRRYPNGTLAPHILGSVGYLDPQDVRAMEEIGFDQDSILGRSGVEASWDETLRGRPGGRLTIVTGSGDVLREVAKSPSQPGQSVWLTIDTDLQQFVLQAMGEAYAQASESWAKTSKGGAAVVMDVNTGGILAMVSWPTFDDNAFAPFPAIGRAAADIIQKQVADNAGKPLLNRAVQGVYPSGSVMKIVDSIGVLDSGVYTPDHHYTCLGNYTWKRDIPRADWLPQGHGSINTQQALTESCDPFFYEVGYQMNQTNPFLLPNYARRLGLGVKTGLRELPEDGGLIPDPDWLTQTYGVTWTFSDAVNMAVGQGYVLVTPLQIARLVATVANGGEVLRPQLVKQAGLIGEAPSFVMQPDVESEIDVKPEVLQIVQNALCEVTTNRAGTAEFVFRNSPLQALDVCGKTGTAENGPVGGDDPPHAWFAAYAPREHPQIAVVVMIENSGEGSEIAAPVVKRIMEYYFFKTKTP